MPSRLRRYDVPGHVHFWTISCYRRLGFLHHDKAKQAVLEGLGLLQARFRICLMGYVIMPEHVHILLYPHPPGSDEPIPVSTLLEAFKARSGMACKAKLRDYWREHGRLWSEPLNCWARGDRKEQAIWKPRGYDFNIDRRDTFIEKLNYCHKNPITRGLVSRAADWPWSSYRFYEMDDRSVLAMDWDGRWPIVW